MTDPDNELSKSPPKKRQTENISEKVSQLSEKMSASRFTQEILFLTILLLHGIPDTFLSYCPFKSPNPTGNYGVI